MLSSNKILELLQNCAQGYLKPDNILFVSCNSELLPGFKKQGAINNTEESKSNKLSDPSINQVVCNVFGCSLVFDNISSYQSHYNVMHRSICAECKKSLPTDHLLDLHISEHHDSYFKARIERGERIYKCFLEECEEMFGNVLERKEHCITRHKFPSNFRFDQTIQKDATSKVKKYTANLELVEELRKPKDRELKTFSFGHQKDKTFCCKTTSSRMESDGATLEDMDTLKQALESM